MSTLVIRVFAAALVAGCSGPPKQRRKPAPAAPVQADKGTLSAIDRMLSERQVRRMRLAGYQLINESDDIVERMERILRVVRMRLRTATRLRQPGRMNCLGARVRRLRRILDDTRGQAAGIEAALRRRDRSRAEKLWLLARMNDMRARDYIYKRCSDTVHVEVEVFGPDGTKRRRPRGRAGSAAPGK